MHPSEISRETGIHMMSVVRILKNTPELFFKVPSIPGREYTGYALTTSMYAREEDDIVKFVERRAMLENLLYWGVLAAIFVAFIYAILTMIPALGETDTNMLFTIPR